MALQRVQLSPLVNIEAFVVPVLSARTRRWRGRFWAAGRGARERSGALPGAAASNLHNWNFTFPPETEGRGKIQVGEI